MKIYLHELLEFFDEKKSSKNGDANGIVSILGEDLNVALYAHYLLKECKYHNVKILPDTVSTGNKKGPRLDRWLLVSPRTGMDVLIQCEIKNWSATAIPGYDLPANANDDQVLVVALRQWTVQLNAFEGTSGVGRDKVSKVLVKMQKPTGYEKVTSKALVCYWMPVSVGRKIQTAFDVPVRTLKLKIETGFKNLSVFSASLYVRSILKKHKVLDLDMPNAERRLKILGILNAGKAVSE